MNAGIVILVLLLAVFVLSIVTHLRPLNNEEVNQLSSKRRDRRITKYFSFFPSEYGVNMDFKKRMNPNGKFYDLSESLFYWPAVAAGLLKYKKHEWILISFERNQNVHMTWMNKGFDRSAVSPYINEHDALEVARETSSTTVLIFHNHPNPDPSSFSCTSPSAPDIESASIWGALLVSNGINLIEFVCERGIHYEYYRRIAIEFMPIDSFKARLEESNGKSKWINLNLHFERIF